MQRLRPVGRVSTNGPNVWRVEDLDAFMRGEEPSAPLPHHEFRSSAVRTDGEVIAVLPVAMEASKPAAVTAPTKAEVILVPAPAPKPVRARAPVRSHRAPVNLRQRPLTTKQLAARFKVSVNEVRGWLARKARWDGVKFIAEFDQFVGMHARGEHWRIYMRAWRTKTSRPPTAARRASTVGDADARQ